MKTHLMVEFGALLNQLNFVVIKLMSWPLSEQLSLRLDVHTGLSVDETHKTRAKIERPSATKFEMKNQTKIVKTKCCSFCVAETLSGTWKQRAAAFGCCLSGLNASRCSAHRHNRTRPQTDADWAGCWTWTAAWDPVLPPLNSSASIGCTPVRNGRTCPSAPAHLYPAPSSRCTHGHTLRLIFPRLRPTVKTCVNVSSAYDIFTFPAENLVRFLFFFFILKRISQFPVNFRHLTCVRASLLCCFSERMFSGFIGRPNSRNDETCWPWPADHQLQAYWFQTLTQFFFEGLTKLGVR